MGGSACCIAQENEEQGMEEGILPQETPSQEASQGCPPLPEIPPSEVPCQALQGSPQAAHLNKTRRKWSRSNVRKNHEFFCSKPNPKSKPCTCCCCNLKSVVSPCAKCATCHEPV